VHHFQNIVQMNINLAQYLQCVLIRIPFPCRSLPLHWSTNTGTVLGGQDRHNQPTKNSISFENHGSTVQPCSGGKPIAIQQVTSSRYLHLLVVSKSQLRPETPTSDNQSSAEAEKFTVSPSGCLLRHAFFKRAIKRPAEKTSKPVTKADIFSASPRMLLL